MAASDFITAHATGSQWRSVLVQCLDRIQTRMAKEPAASYTLGFCYLTDYFAPMAEQILALLRERLPGTAWVGTVGVGIIAEDREYFDEPAITLMLAPLARQSLRLFSGRQPLRSGESGFVAHTALVHADGSAPDLQDLLRELADRTATGYLFGGLCSARNNSVQIADAALSGGLSGVAFDASVGIVSRVTQGCRPIGGEHRITRSESNVVVELDHEPALSCATRELGLEADSDVETIAAALSSTLVGLRADRDDSVSVPGRFGPDTRVRHIIGLDPRHGVFAVADEVDDDMWLAFCERNPDAAMNDLHRMVREIQSTLQADSQSAAGAIYVSCNGRGGPHFGAPNAEARVIRNVLGDIPLVGFFAAGEIARDRLYGYTGVLTVFTRPA